MPLRLYIDAISRGSPGPAGVGVVIRDADDHLLKQMGRFLGERSDLEAAVQSLLIGLEAAAPLAQGEVAILSSSAWLVRQVTGQGRDPGDRLAELLTQAQMLLLQFDTWQISHLPCSENQLAGSLAHHALATGRDVPSPRPEPVVHQEQRPTDSPVVVRVIQAGDTRACPEPCGIGEVFEFTDVAPGKMCIEALAAVLDAVMICRRRSGPAAEHPPLTRACAKPGCGARFEIDRR